jgi:His-Xaa-Ser system radical SAM maturase HxsC
MEQIIVLRRKAHQVEGLNSRSLGRIVLEADEEINRSDCIRLVCNGGGLLSSPDTEGYVAILVEEGAENQLPREVLSPCVYGLQNLAEITQNSIVAISPNGSVNTLFRPESHHNAIFATGRCNSNCLMCSQPPSNEEIDVAELLRLIHLIKEAPEALGITGGEPTLLGDRLIQILRAIQTRFPNVELQMLTNGRNYANAEYVSKVAAAAPEHFLSAIPLYADNPDIHDWVVQAKGAFDETIRGLYNTARYGLRVEIRVVLHKLTIPRLVPLMQFIYRNLPFVSHIALMGLENMGYVKKNKELLWIDPLDYAPDLEKAVKTAYYYGMNVSIYNLPLCVLPKTLWPFARQSISDFKNLYFDACNNCSVRNKCAGLFSSSYELHSRGISPL